MIEPREGERAPGAWEWYTPEDLAAGDFASDVARLGIDAVETVR